MTCNELAVSYSLSDATPNGITVQIDNPMVAETIEHVARVMRDCMPWPRTTNHLGVALTVTNMARERVPVGTASVWTSERVQLLRTGCQGLSGLSAHLSEFLEEFGFDPSRLDEVTHLLNLADAMIQHERRAAEVA